MRPYFYLGGNRGLTQLSSGEFFYVNTEDRSITPWILHDGYWELFVDDILCALARPGDTFVDVGANMGYYTVKIGAKVGPAGRVYSFEPNAAIFDILRDNVEINTFTSRTTLSNAAVGAAAGEAWLSFARRAPGGAAVRVEQFGLENEVKVDVQALDEVIPADHPVHLIKIDVEGFEPPALEGMRNLLRRSTDCAVVVEMVYEHWAAFGDPMSLLLQAADGRQIYLIHEEGWIELLPENDPSSVLDKGLACYMLLLPRTPERRRQVEVFLKAGNDPRPVSLRLTRTQRLIRRLRDWFQFG